jgi:NADH dehydrogenase
MNLVVGATGVLGSEICRLLAERGKKVRALVRSTSATEKKETLRKLGIELVEGDLKNPPSLSDACRGVENILSTATAIVSQQADDSLINADRDGHLSLIDSAEKAGVRRFVFISFPPIDISFPLQDAKRAVEHRLLNSKLTPTILQPTLFQEIWLGPHLGFDAVNGKVRIYGDGQNKISWISFRDVAKFAVESLYTPATENQTLPLGGPEAISPLEVVKIFEEMSGREFQVEHVPEEALKEQYKFAVNAIQMSFAALMLSYLQDSIIDMNDALKMMPIQQQSVRDYARSVVGKA